LVTAWTKGATEPSFVVSLMTPSGEVERNPKVRLTSKRGFGIRSHASFSANHLRNVPWGRAWATSRSAWANPPERISNACRTRNASRWPVGWA